MENLTVKLENQVGNEITWREGRAADPLPLKEPKVINISGDIHSISNFLKQRFGESSGFSSQEVDRSKVIVTADKHSRTITMLLDPENHYGATVIGRLESSDELKQFYINEEKKFDRQQLQKLIKFSRLYFDNKEQHAQVLLSITKLRVKTESELKQENDNRGNKTNSFERKVIDDSGFVQFFHLFIPIFKGFPPVKFQVEICFEPSESGILFWLESPELHEIKEGKVNEIFEDELQACEGFVIINK
jgi:hypothetical protein